MNWSTKIEESVDQPQIHQICGSQPQKTQQIQRSKFELFFLGQNFLGKFSGEIGEIGGSNSSQPLLWYHMMGPKATCVARSHELTKNKRGWGMNTKNTTKNTANARNTTRYNSGLLPIARTTIPIESLKGETRGRIPERKIGIRSVESHEWETGGRITSVRD